MPPFRSVAPHSRALSRLVRASARLVGTAALLAAMAPVWAAAQGTARHAAKRTTRRPDSAAVRAATEDFWRRSAVAFKAADADALAALFTPDAVLSFAGAEARGRAAIRAALAQQFTRVTFGSLDHTAARFQTDGEMAVEEGAYYYTVTQKAPPNAAQPVRDRYLFVWRRQPGGAWLATDYVDMPALPAARP